MLCESLPDKVRVFGEFSEEVMQAESRIGAIYLREGECLNAVEHLKAVTNYRHSNKQKLIFRSSVSICKSSSTVQTILALRRRAIRSKISRSNHGLFVSRLCHDEVFLRQGSDGVAIVLRSNRRWQATGASSISNDEPNLSREARPTTTANQRSKTACQSQSLIPHTIPDQSLRCSLVSSRKHRCASVCFAKYE